MQSSKSAVKEKYKHPVLPAFLKAPLKIIPVSFHGGVMTVMLNRILKDDLIAGDLDFLQGRSVSLKVLDAAVTCQLTMLDGKLRIFHSREKCDLTIQAMLYDFLTLMSRQEDPDTLVFQRRLVMEGDTELGLSLKNYIDGMDVESSRLLPFIETLAGKMLPVYKRVFG